MKKVANAQILLEIQKLRENELHEIGCRLVELEVQGKRTDQRLDRIKEKLETIPRFEALLETLIVEVTSPRQQ